MLKQKVNSAGKVNVSQAEEFFKSTLSGLQTGTDKATLLKAFEKLGASDRRYVTDKLDSYLNTNNAMLKSAIPMGLVVSCLVYMISGAVSVSCITGAVVGAACFFKASASRDAVREPGEKLLSYLQGRTSVDKFTSMARGFSDQVFSSFTSGR